LEDRDGNTQNVRVCVTAYLRSSGGQNLCSVVVAKKIVKCYIWSIAFYGDNTWTLQKVDHKFPESFVMWRWREMEEINLTDHVKTEQVLHRIKEVWNILHTHEGRLNKLVALALELLSKIDF
jgi:hypothetical protein